MDNCDNQKHDNISCDISTVDNTNNNNNNNLLIPPINSYDELTKEGNLFVKMIPKQNEDENNNNCNITIQHFKFNNLTVDITLSQLIEFIKEKEDLSFDIDEWLFAYKINISKGNTNKTLYKILDESCLLINDMLSNNENNTSNIFLLPNENSKNKIKQNNGILLNPKRKLSTASSSSTSISPSANTNDNTGSKPESTPTINTINKIITPNITVLVVEDNPINCKILSKILKKHKINYKLAKNGLEAIKMYSLRRN